MKKLILVIMLIFTISANATNYLVYQQNVIDMTIFYSNPFITSEIRLDAYNCEQAAIGTLCKFKDNLNDITKPDYAFIALADGTRVCYYFTDDETLIIL
jgi:hypothetical protein